MEFLLNDPLRPRDRLGGVGRYTRRMAEGLSAVLGERLAIYSGESLAPGSAARWVRSPKLPLARLVPVHDLRLPGLVRRLGARVVFSPYFGRVAAGVPEVFTVHDLTYFALPQRRGWNGWMEERVRAEQRDCFHRAAALIAVSEATRQDLLARFPEVPAEKVFVVPHGVDPVFFQSSGAEGAATAAAPGTAPTGRPVLLYVGKRTGYKNFIRLLEAWRVAGLGASAELRVVAPPGDQWTPEEAAALARSGAGEAIRMVAAADDEALRREYAGAVALVYPSAREGFGLPLLEAMAAGTLIVCSSATSLPEVGGPVPFYHDAESTEELAARLREVLALGPAERAVRLRLGRERASSFTWEAAVERTCQILKAMATADVSPRRRPRYGSSV